ncbi:hypothetical protein [Lewinella sp. LCG006]|uniref:hypothetical protein n=1 Tax=Lewinella sp. LCG006 TaxID=3231911 RepID=UPI0034615A04
MHKAFYFVNPIEVKGLEMPALSPQMMYLIATDVEQKGKAAILRQLARLFEIDLEELLHPVLEQEPAIFMRYDPDEEEWEFLGERTDKDLMLRTYQLATSMKTGEIDDEIADDMLQQGWSSFRGLKEEVDKMLQLITAYPFFWRAIKYQDQDWLKPYLEQAIPEHSEEEQIITAFHLDVQALARYCQEAGQQKLLWFAKHY